MTSQPGTARADQTRARAAAFAAPGDALQDRLAALWEAVLGTAPIGIDDDFFANGGTREREDRMFAGVEWLCGSRLHWGDVPGPSTVRSLADALVARLSQDRVVQVQDGDPAAAPLFFVHGDLGGGGYYVRELARGLGPRPVYVLHPHGLAGEDMPPSIEAMARDHLASVRERLPDGAFFLGGRCNGAVIALEMADQLSREGRRPQRLVLVDPRLPSDERPRLAPLPRLTPAQRRAPAIRAPWLLTAYLTHVFSYQPRPYAGDVAAFWPAEETDRWATSLAALRRVVPQVESYTAPGTHVTLVGRQVRDLAAAIQRCLVDG